MERWAQILLGTILSSVGLFVFYLIFEKFFKNFKGSRAKEVMMMMMLMMLLTMMMMMMMMVVVMMMMMIMMMTATPWREAAE